MTGVAVHGVGMSRFGRQADRDLSTIVAEAVREAFDDAGSTAIDAVWVGTVFGTPGVAQRVLRTLGITRVPVVTVENACASGTTAFGEACESVRTERYGRVLALGLEHMTTVFAGPIVPECTDPEGRSGFALPALYAMSAARRLHDGAVTREELAAVSVKNKHHASLNPRAPFGAVLSIENVLESRMIADPLTLLQCCPTSDGAAAAVLAPATRAGGEVRIRGLSARSGEAWDQCSPNVWGHDLVRDTTTELLAAADLERIDEIDFVELHDAFTIGEIVTTEAMGLFEIGDGGAAARAGHTSLGGPVPVNPSGGLLGRGHPLGATGLAQIAEATWQLRGQAADRQIPGARLGLVETMGGGVSVLDGNACVMTILEAW